MDDAEAVRGAAVDGRAFDGEDVGAGCDSLGFGLVSLPVGRGGDGVFPVRGFVVAERGVHAFEFVDCLVGGGGAPLDDAGAGVEG